MSLDEGARRVDRAVRDDWETRMRVHDARVSSHDEMRIDGERRIAAWFRAGMLVLEAPADLIGVFTPDLGLFRWWWSGNEPKLLASRLDEAFAYAQQRNDLRALLTRQHQLDGEEDAAMLCRLAAYFANATGLVRQVEGARVSFYAIFAASARPPIVPDLDIVRTLPPPAVAPRPSAPPPATLEPSRELLLPVVQVAGDLLRRRFAEHAQRGLIVINVDTSRDKARFFVTLVGATNDGDLAAVDTTRELLDAAGAMLLEDARSGNARWRKLVVRIDLEDNSTAISRCDVSA